METTPPSTPPPNAQSADQAQHVFQTPQGQVMSAEPPDGVGPPSLPFRRGQASPVGNVPRAGNNATATPLNHALQGAGVVRALMSDTDPEQGIRPQALLF